jgi:hypothetical protein
MRRIFVAKPQTRYPLLFVANNARPGVP